MNQGVALYVSLDESLNVLSASRAMAGRWGVTAGRNMNAFGQISFAAGARLPSPGDPPVQATARMSSDGAVLTGLMHRLGKGRYCFVAREPLPMGQDASGVAGPARATPPAAPVTLQSAHRSMAAAFHAGLDEIVTCMRESLESDSQPARLAALNSAIALTDSLRGRTESVLGEDGTSGVRASLDAACKDALERVESSLSKAQGAVVYENRARRDIIICDERDLTEALVSVLRLLMLEFPNAMAHGVVIEDAERDRGVRISIDCHLGRAGGATPEQDVIDRFSGRIEVVRRFLVAAGGDLEVSMQAGSFSVVLLLPAQLGAAQAERRAGLALVVDDQLHIRRQLERYLTELGFEVLVASGAQSAIELLQSIVPAVVFLDLILPDQSGMDVLRALRCREETAAVPVIVVSGSDDVAESMRQGASAHMVKPIWRNDVHSLVKATVSRAGAALVPAMLKRGATHLETAGNV